MTNDGLRITDYGLRITDYGLRITDYSHLINYQFLINDIKKVKIINFKRK